MGIANLQRLSSPKPEIARKGRNGQGSLPRTAGFSVVDSRSRCTTERIRIWSGSAPRRTLSPDLELVSDEEEAETALGRSPGSSLPLQVARSCPELVAAYRIHLGATMIRFEQFRRMRESVEIVRVEVNRVLDRE